MTTRTKPPRAELEKQLDKALQETFPASDPGHVGIFTAGEPDRPIGRRPARIDKALVDKLAKQVAEHKKGAA